MCCSKRNKKISVLFSWMFLCLFYQSLPINNRNWVEDKIKIYGSKPLLWQSSIISGWMKFNAKFWTSTDSPLLKLWRTILQRCCVWHLVCGLHSWKYLRRSRTKVVQAGCLWTILYPRPRARGWVLSVSHVQHVRNTTSDRNVSYSWSLWPSHEQPLTSGMLGKLFTEEIEGPELFI